MRRKNILLIINQLHGGGAQKAIAALSKQLAPLHNVTLLVYNDLDNISFSYAGELHKARLPFAENTHKNSFTKRFIRFITLVNYVWKLKKKKKIDVSISYMEASNIINLLSRRKEKAIISVRSYLSIEFKDQPKLKVFKSFIKLLYNKADKVIVPAQLIKVDLEENFGVCPKKIEVIYNFIDVQNVTVLAQQPIEPHIDYLLKNNRVIVNVGRINSPKAQWLLPGVLYNVKKSVSNTKLLILGEGQLENMIIENAEKLGLRVFREGKTLIKTREEINDFDIIITGFVQYPYPYLRQGEVFIKSSVYEGFPNVITEAMATGLPIISSDCSSGPREILSPGTDIRIKTKTIEYAEFGILVPVHEDEAGNDYIQPASIAVTDILTNAEKKEYYRKQSMIRVTDFDKTIIVQQWKSIIEK